MQPFLMLSVSFCKAVHLSLYSFLRLPAQICCCPSGIGMGAGSALAPPCGTLSSIWICPLPRPTYLALRPSGHPHAPSVISVGSEVILVCVCVCVVISLYSFPFSFSPSRVLWNARKKNPTPGLCQVAPSLRPLNPWPV